MNQQATATREFGDSRQLTAEHWTLLLADDGLHEADLRLAGSEWNQWQVSDSNVDTKAVMPANGYVAPWLPVEFHCHGLQGMDFSDFTTLDLSTADRAARDEGILCVLTMFLPEDQVSDFEGFMRLYDEFRHSHPNSHIVGVALEGPLLASSGGTPQDGSWVPSQSDWCRIAKWGDYGLKYVVLSPDAYVPGSNLASDAIRAPSIAAIVDTLLHNDVLPALGHFQRSDPKASAESVSTVITIAKRYGKPVLTDHLFNDMPLSFQHAWRTVDEKISRDPIKLADELSTWTPDNLEVKVGAVPATLIRAARANRAILCVNFDGDHVDHAVCRRLQQLVDSDRMIAMTDRIETPTLAGTLLERSANNSLWYRSNGTTVAAGSTSIDRAMGHLRHLGVSELAIWRLAGIVPYRILGLELPQYAEAPMPERCSWVDSDGTRHFRRSEAAS